MCRAKTGYDSTKGIACSCGLAFPAKLWRRPDPNRWKCVCKLDWGKFVEAQEHFPGNQDLHKWVGDLKAKYGPMEDWPHIGCGSKFRPWAKGASMVVELKMGNGEWQSFMAEQMPNELDDAINSHHAAFAMAQRELTPNDIFDILPVT